MLPVYPAHKCPCSQPQRDVEEVAEQRLPPLHVKGEVMALQPGCACRNENTERAGLLGAQRTEATVRAPDGSTFKVTKGAAAAVLSLIDTNPEVTGSAVNRKARPTPLPSWSTLCLASIA